jgi:hypothetical protein
MKTITVLTLLAAFGALAFRELGALGAFSVLVSMAIFAVLINDCVRPGRAGGRELIRLPPTRSGFGG